MERTMLIFGGRGTSTQVLLLMRSLYSSHIACFQLGSRKAWNGDLGIEGGGGDGGGGVVGVVCGDDGGGGVGVLYGDSVDDGVRGVVCGVVCNVVCGGVC
nr:hypothetical protein [Tanacetum cinerariifolium]